MKILKHPGFTLVELLIVIVVIAILAAISVVAYSNVQNRAYNSTVATTAASIAKGFQLYKIQNGHLPLHQPDNDSNTGNISGICVSSVMPDIASEGPENECICSRFSNDSPWSCSSSGYTVTDIANELKPVFTLPDTSKYVVKSDNTAWRGIVYSARDGDAEPHAEEGYLYYNLRGNVECPTGVPGGMIESYFFSGDMPYGGVTSCTINL